MKFKSIIPALAVALLISGCSNTAVSDSSETGPVDGPVIIEEDHANASNSTEAKENAQTETPSKEQADPNAVTKEELEEFTSLFNEPDYNGFLTKSFSNPSEIDWHEVMVHGAGISVFKIDDAELADFKVVLNGGYYSESNDLIVIRRSALEEFALKHTGEALGADKKTLPWTYVDKYDSFYRFEWSSTKNAYTCVSGEKDGSDYTLRLQVDGDAHIGTSADRVVQLTKTDDGVIIKSNQIQWDDGCDKEQTFDVDLKGNGETVHFVTYPGYSNAARFFLIKNGNVVYTDLINNYYYEETMKMKTVTAVGFFDFNADGIKDIAFVGDSDQGQHILLYESVDANYSYEPCELLSEALEQEIYDNLSISKIKSSLLGDNTSAVYNTYQEAYAQVALLYQWNAKGYEYEYGLIDGNGDDIPELVITVADAVSLYTFENGHVHCLMYRWVWGAGGNHGYDYAPGKNVYFNDNADMAGAIHYDNFMVPSEGVQLQQTYEEKLVFIEDIDGDGVISEEEEMESIDSEYCQSFYYNYTDQDLTPEELEAKINELWSYDYVALRGEVGYQDFLAVLKNG